MLTQIAERRLIANRLLAAVGRAAYRRLMAELEPVALTFGMSISPTTRWFPC